MTALDAANRLTEVRQATVVLASFVYAADGSRVKGTVGGVTTVYIAGVYEQSGGGSTSYYEGGVMRRSGHAENNGVFYLLQDQLKSTSVIVGQGGVEAARQFFYPYGGNRGGTAMSDLTTRRFTGQYHEQGLPGTEGLSYYNARWYDPQLGRFASADTIVPNPLQPQSLNRYAYAQNNPAAFDDPSGHCPLCPFVVQWGLRAAVAIAAAASMRSSSPPPSVVEQYASTIILAARKQGVSPVIVGAIIDHESSNINRFSGMGDSAQWGARRLIGNSGGSYGLGQVQLATVIVLENAGRVPKLANDEERIAALMDNETNIKYVAAKLSYDRSRISTWYASIGVPITEEEKNGLMMLSYNQGWDDPNSKYDVFDNLNKYSGDARALLVHTQALAFHGTLADGTPINQYHVSEMWNPLRIARVEQALNVCYR